MSMNGNTTEQLTSVELLFLLDLNVTFEIVLGCFSSMNNKYEFEFTDVMKQSKIKTFTIEEGQKVEHTGASYYAMWCGFLGHKSEYKYQYCHTGDKDLLNTICNNYELDEFEIKSEKEAKLRLPKLHSKYCPQVLAFIVSYARIAVLSQLFEFIPESVVRVNADAFFFTGEIPKLHDKFRNKDDGIIKNNEGGRRYYNNTQHVFSLNDNPDDHMIEDNYIRTSQLIPLTRHNNNGEYTYMHNILLKIGCGGGGKTWSALSDKGYNNVLYVAPSHKLLVAKKEEFKEFKTCTLAKLTGNAILSTEEEEEYKKQFGTEEKKEKKIGCQILYNVYSPATVICDEITQYTDHQKELIIQTYKYSKIIF
jgi:hypothetical protein